MIAVLLLSLFLVTVHGLDNGLARTPPMGWLSWERYRCNTNCVDPKTCISETLYKDMADRMAADGFKEAGYEYVNIDDCWSLKKRDPVTGRIVPDPKRFPSGMKALADYIHSKGLKIGIYGDFGTLTCGGYPGSIFDMQLDAQTFAEWGIDSLKLDGCYADTKLMPDGYERMGYYLNKTGRPMLYSCSWPAYVVGGGKIPDYAAIAKSCNLWRNYDDISDSWDSVKGIINFYAKDVGNFSTFAGPGNFNDPDMLIVGDFGLSYDQSRVQMAMWSIMASPLYMSNDLRKMSPEAKALLLNKGLIKINQDPLGIQGRPVLTSSGGRISVWKKTVMPTGSAAFAVLDVNQDGDQQQFQMSAAQLGLTHSKGYNLTDVIEGTFVQTVHPSSFIKGTVHLSGVTVYLATPL